MSLPEDRFLSPSFDGDALTKERKDNMKKDKELVKGVNQVMTLSQSIFSRGITEGEARNFIFSVKTLMKNTNKSKEEVLAMLGKTNQDYINVLQILSDNK